MGQPVTVVVGALPTADADGISAAQAAAAAQYLVLNGAFADEVANNICASQSPGGAVDLTINGSAATGGIAYLPSPRRVYITSAGNDSGRTFTVYGQIYTQWGVSGVVETVTGANTSVVSTSNAFSKVTRVAISGASAAAVTVGVVGVATMDVARRVAIDSAGDDTLISFTISGTDVNGSPISEVVVGVNNAVATSVLSYATVTGVLTSGAVASTVEVGSSAVADSQWIRFDDYAANAQVAIQATVSGTVNYTIQQTMDDPNSATFPVTPQSVTWVNHPDTAVVAATATKQTNYGYPPIFAKVVLNSGTGTVTTTMRQVYLN